MAKKKVEPEAPVPAQKVVPLVVDQTYTKPDTAMFYGTVACLVSGCSAVAEVYDYGKGKYVFVHQTAVFPRSLHQGAFGEDGLSKVTKL